jgi:hypothetical protein
MIACTTTVALPSGWIVTPGSPNSESRLAECRDPDRDHENRDDHDRAPHPDFLVEVDVHHGLTE